ncbi:tripartite tricarboxylate transporter TctB family protein [Rhodobacter sp. NTK016B]|uniref:tripartite tricarboxylate transporter TctB family protein n=1 Tax=Rhodobacter sp. NTK016B TaxID=2759676 RepID=UPI0025707606|nr:tripartite tricarboxylate transporter TctB family protein [Rhodobacter sp. NTK016B]
MGAVQRDHESIIGGVAVLGLSALLYSQVMPGQFDGVALARNPMTVPRFLLALFALGGAYLLVRGLVSRAGTTWPAVAWRKVLAIAVLAAAYFWAFDPIGFIPATLVLLPLAFLSLGYRNPLVIAAVTLITAPLLWYVFAEGFSIRPPGFGMDDLLRALGGM